jgi:hypothetical protein
MSFWVLSMTTEEGERARLARHRRDLLEQEADALAGLSEARLSVESDETSLASVLQGAERFEAQPEFELGRHAEPYFGGAFGRDASPRRSLVTVSSNGQCSA